MDVAGRETLLSGLRSYYRWPRHSGRWRNTRHRAAAIDLPDRTLSRDPDGLGHTERPGAGENVDVGRESKVTAQKIKHRRARKIFGAVAPFRAAIQARRLRFGANVRCESAGDGVSWRRVQVPHL